MNGLNRFISKHLSEVVLGLAFCALLWQGGILSALSDLQVFGFEEWTRTHWIIANAVALFLLVCVRWMPDLLNVLSGRRSTTHSKKLDDAVDDPGP